MTKFKTLNDITLGEGFEYLSNKEPLFKKILEEKNYKIAPFSKKERFKEEGLSKQKIDYCSGIAIKIIDKELNLKQLEKKNDTEVISELIKIRGIGDWTAQCYLMACLKRLDAWPSSDLGLIV